MQFCLRNSGQEVYQYGILQKKYAYEDSHDYSMPAGTGTADGGSGTGMSVCGSFTGKPEMV